MPILEQLFPVGNFVKELLFPSFCCVCGKKTENTFLCQACKSKISFFEYPLIEHIDNVKFFGIARYEGVLEKAIKEFKFNGLKALANDFSEIVLSFLHKEGIQFDYVSYVPMTFLEILGRGYNQTKLIAEVVASTSKKPIYEGVVKVKKTKKQVGLNKTHREENVKGAFKLNKVPERGTMLILDDVYTTGSTAREIGKCFRHSKAIEVVSIALARTLSI